jgi:hypothetical protein
MFRTLFEKRYSVCHCGEYRIDEVRFSILMHPTCLEISSSVKLACSTLSIWWSGASDRLSRRDAKVVNFAIMLVFRALWVERNARVFEGSVFPAGVVLDKAIEEWNLWLSSRCGSLRGVS